MVPSLPHPGVQLYLQLLESFLELVAEAEGLEVVAQTAGPCPCLVPARGKC